MNVHIPGAMAGGSVFSIPNLLGGFQERPASLLPTATRSRISRTPGTNKQIDREYFLRYKVTFE